ncbi:MAG: NAD-dependent epimerase/dehydratase family protein [Bdellovibrionota bacterium]
MLAWDEVKKSLPETRSTWFITGAAGFIGSNLCEFLLKHNQNVIGLDNLSTGRTSNIKELESIAASVGISSFKFHEGDIRDYELCKSLIYKSDYVLHQAALGSVPRSIKDPITSNSANVDGTLCMLEACRNSKLERFVFASSSSVYGSSPELPKKEGGEGQPLSPYAITKVVNEIYAMNYSALFDLSTVGLRYFNVFGQRQDPNGDYAAVIPRWIAKLVNGQVCDIYGDGETSRDFCYIDNVIQANILAAKANLPAGSFTPLNIACGDHTTLNQLYAYIQAELLNLGAIESESDPSYLDFRSGDVRHSLADISSAFDKIGYDPEVDVFEGLKRSIRWYVENLPRN